MFLQKSPSKFTGGISALWRGMNLTYLNRRTIMPGHYGKTKKNGMKKKKMMKKKK